MHEGLIQVDHHTVLAVVINAGLGQEVFSWRLLDSTAQTKDGWVQKKGKQAIVLEAHERREMHVYHNLSKHCCHALKIVLMSHANPI